jgi:hypothetical protein
MAAATSIQVPFALTTVTPFTNLSLGAGSYYLIMAGYNTGENGIYGPDWSYPQYGVMSYTGTVVPNTTAQAPEIDPSLTMSALTFLVGALAVLRRPARRAAFSF